MSSNKYDLIKIYKIKKKNIVFVHNLETKRNNNTDSVHKYNYCQTKGTTFIIYNYWVLIERKYYP